MEKAPARHIVNSGGDLYVKGLPREVVRGWREWTGLCQKGEAGKESRWVDLRGETVHELRGKTAKEVAGMLVSGEWPADAAA